MSAWPSGLFLLRKVLAHICAYMCLYVLHTLNNLCYSYVRMSHEIRSESRSLPNQCSRVQISRVMEFTSMLISRLGTEPLVLPHALCLFSLLSDYRCVTGTVSLHWVTGHNLLSRFCTEMPSDVISVSKRSFEHSILWIVDWNP